MADITSNKIVITIERTDDGLCFARAAYDFGKGLQSNILTHEYVDKADLLTKIEETAKPDIEGVIYQRVPGNDDIKQYYLQSKCEPQSIINFVNVISQVSTQAGIKVFVSDGFNITFYNRFELKKIKGYQIDEYDYEEKLASERMVESMATASEKKLGLNNEKHI